MPSGELRGVLNGLRYKVAKENDEIYIIMGGKRRWIESEHVWNTVFRNAGFDVDASILDVEPGKKVTASTCLVRNQVNGEICLVEPDYDTVHPLTTPEVQIRYGLGEGNLENLSSDVYKFLLKGRTRDVLKTDW